MRVAEVSQETSLPKYVCGLFSTESRKTCTNMAASTNQTHDAIYRPFKNPTEESKVLREQLIDLAKRTFSGNKTYLILDDSQLSKPHAQEIEGLDICFDGSAGRTALCLQMITALLTDGSVRMPLNAVPYITKQIARAYFKTKSELAVQITSLLLHVINVDVILADAHYSTRTFLPFLNDLGQNFLMKFTCNRIVKIGRNQGQLRNLLRLRRNERIRSAKGLFDGIPYYFYAAKIKNGIIVYFISLHLIEQQELLAMYKIRWNIELYHRTAKQSLGWKDCQMKSIKKQVLHTFYVMYTYAIAELIRIKKNFGATEDALRHLSIAKNRRHINSLFRAGENLC